MIIVRLHGQMGNQMFCYATAYAASKIYNEKLIVYKYEYDTLYRMDGFQIKKLMIDCKNFYVGIPISLYLYTTKKLMVKLINKFFKKKVFIMSNKYQNKQIDIVDEVLYEYTKIDLDKKKNIHIIDGFRQSPLYFDQYYDEIVNQFKPNYKLSSETLKWISKIKNDRHSVALHIRRGDYIKIGWCLSLDYYYKAMKMITERYPDAVFYVFSDDIPWVKDNLKVPQYNVKYVERTCRVPAFDDIWTMSKCENNIIANSSFSWWGAYLNQTVNKIVIAPIEIYKNNRKIIPKDWHVIE